MEPNNLSNWIIPDLSRKNVANQLERFILAKIKNKEIQPGEDLPSCRKLAKINKINAKTVHNVYLRLAFRGWLTNKPGSNTSVALFPPERSDVAPSQEDLAALISPVRQAKKARSESKVRASYVSIGPHTLNHTHDLEDKIARLCLQHRRTLADSTQIQKLADVRGDDLHLSIYKYLHDIRLMPLNPDQLLISHGHEHTLDFISKLIPDTAGIINAAGPGIYNQYNFERTQHSVYTLNPTDTDFLKQLTALVAQHPIRLLYVRPGCLFPKGEQMSSVICQTLIELSIKEKFFILEDEDEHEFRETKQPFKLLWEYQHQGRVIYCGALSRLNTYVQNIRTVVAADQILALLKELQETNIGYRNLDKERAIAQLLTNGEFARLVRKIRQFKSEDLNDMQQIFDHYLKGYMTYSLPESGLVVWLEFHGGINLRNVLKLLESQGITVPYFPDNQKMATSIRHMRLDISHYVSMECRIAASKLQSIYRKMLGM